MQHLPAIELMHRVVRARICDHCCRRPPGSESWGPTAARDCELDCPIFFNLPALAAIARDLVNNACPSYELAIRDRICRHCTRCQSSGDFCADGFARECPLSIHGRDVIQAITPIVLDHPIPA